MENDRSYYHHRHSIQLQGYNYSQAGAYFITIVTNNRECLFGEIKNGTMILNDTGKIVQQCWLEIPNHFPNAELDEFVIMPNHIHGIIVLNNIVGVQNNAGVQNFEPLQKQNQYQKIIPKSVGSIVRGFKIGVTKWFRHNTKIYIVWQRNYYEHITRTEDDLKRIRQYIINNPLNWKSDENYNQ